MRVRYEDLAMIAENLGNLYDDGITISEGLDLLKELPLHNNYRESVKDIHSQVLLGRALWEAFSKYSKLYPGLFIGILKVGENSGQLGKSLKKVSEFYSKLWNVKKEVINALIYPAFLVSAMILLGVFLAFVIIPSFYESYMGSGGEVPKIAEFLYNLRESYNERPIIFFAFILSYLPIPPIIIYAILKYRIKKQSIFLKFRIVREVEEFIFILILSLILDSGVSLPIGIEYCTSSKDVKFLKDYLENMSRDIIRGRELSEAIENLPFLSRYSLAMIKLGENSGSLSERVRKAEERMETRIKERIAKLLSLIQPTLIVTMAVGVLIFIWIFVLPMFDMIYGGVV